MNGPLSDDLLHAYVDGRLDAQRRTEVEACLQRDPRQAQRVADWKRDAERLRALFADTRADASAAAWQPGRLRRRLRRRRGLWLAAAAAWLLAFGVGGTAGWFWREQRLAAERLPMADAVAAYRLFAGAGLPMEFDPPRRAALQTWLHAQFGAAGDVPDLEPQGFRLQGGRALSTPEGAAALLVYEDPAGTRIALYLRPRTRQTLAGERRDGRLLAHYWAEGDTAFALVGPATQTPLHKIAPLLQGAG